MSGRGPVAVGGEDSAVGADARSTGRAIPAVTGLTLGRYTRGRSRLPLGAVPAGRHEDRDPFENDMRRRAARDDAVERLRPSAFLAPNGQTGGAPRRDRRRPSCLARRLDDDRRVGVRRRCGSARAEHVPPSSRCSPRTARPSLGRCRARGGCASSGRLARLTVRDGRAGSRGRHTGVLADGRLGDEDGHLVVGALGRRVDALARSCPTSVETSCVASGPRPATDRSGP